MVNFVKSLVGMKSQEDPPAVAVEGPKDEIQSVSYEQFMKMASEKLEPVTSRGKILLDKAKESDNTQHKVIGASRGVFDVAAIAVGPAGGAVGAVVGSLDPEMTKQISDKIEKATHGVWNDLSFEQKLFGLASGAGVGVVVSYYYFPVLTYLVIMVANVYAAKCGADLAVKNYRSEKELHEQKRRLGLLSEDQEKRD